MVTQEIMSFVNSLGLKEVCNEFKGPCVFGHFDIISKDGFRFNPRVNAHGGFFCRGYCVGCEAGKKNGCSPPKLYSELYKVSYIDAMFALGLEKEIKSKTSYDHDLTRKKVSPPASGGASCAGANSVHSVQAPIIDQKVVLDQSWLESEVKKSCERLALMPVEAKTELINKRFFTRSEILELASLGLLGWGWASYLYSGLVCPVRDHSNNISTVNYRIKRGCEKSDQRWFNIKGGQLCPLILKSRASNGNYCRDVTIIVEGAIDALYLWTVYNKKFNVIGLLGAGHKYQHNQYLRQFLASQEIIIISLDNDNAGNSNSEYWLNQYQKKAVRLAPDNGFKGVGDMPRLIANGFVLPFLSDYAVNRKNEYLDTLSSFHRLDQLESLSFERDLTASEIAERENILASWSVNRSILRYDKQRNDWLGCLSSKV